MSLFGALGLRALKTRVIAECREEGESAHKAGQRAPHRVTY